MAMRTREPWEQHFWNSFSAHAQILVRPTEPQRQLWSRRLPSRPPLCRMAVPNSVKCQSSTLVRFMRVLWGASQQCSNRLYRRATTNTIILYGTQRCMRQFFYAGRTKLRQHNGTPKVYIGTNRCHVFAQEMQNTLDHRKVACEAGPHREAQLKPRFRNACGASRIEPSRPKPTRPCYRR